MQSNRTVGLFYPTDDASRVVIDGENSVKKMVAQYKGREKMSEGEAFDPSPMNIQMRTKFGELDSGLEVRFVAEGNSWRPSDASGQFTLREREQSQGNERRVGHVATVAFSWNQAIGIPGISRCVG